MPPASLTPVPAATKADMVEERLLAHLRERGYAPGDALPGEVELAAQLAVSRSVIREALSRLRMLGLVRSRQRAGMTMGHPDIPGTLAKLLDAAFLDREHTDDLRELRLVIELGIAPLVAARRSESDLIELRDLVAAERAVAADIRKSRALDARFHAVLYRIADNQLVTTFQGLLPSFFARADPAAFAPGRFKDPTLVSHADLLEPLAAGDAVAYTDAMRRHLQPHQR